MRNVIIASFATLVLGCGAEDEGETTAATTVSTTAMSTTDASAGSEEDSGDEDPTDDPSTTATTAPATTDPSTTAATEDSGGAEDPGTTTDAEETGPAEESSTGAAGSVCDPDPMGDPCDECTKMKCCPQLETCFADPICECMSMCVMGFADFDPCTQMCGETANFTPVTDCAAGMCLLECLG